MSVVTVQTFCVETWGCQMNQHDSERIAGQLVAAGLEMVASANEADLVLLNTCSVRERPVHKVLTRIGQLELLSPPPLIGVCGCVAQLEADELLRRSPRVRLVLGPGHVETISRALAVLRQGRSHVAVGFSFAADRDDDTAVRQSQTRAMITIIEGCEQNCTFCIVPFARGPEVSRSRAEVLISVRQAAAAGLREVELLGQTVNAYRCPDSGADLADLLEEVAQVPGIDRVRYVTSHPRYFSDRLISVLHRHRKVSRYLHLPFQAGADTVLKRMHRCYTRSEYLELVHRIRTAVPDINLSTDVIAGFPGETEADFEHTLEVLREVRFGQVFAFAYSPRPGTPAARLDDDVPEDEKRHRLHRLFALTDFISRELNEQLIGSTASVLIDGESRKRENDWQGRGEDNRVVNFPKVGSHGVGDLVEVRITRAATHSLYGEITGYSRRLPVM